MRKTTRITALLLALALLLPLLPATALGAEVEEEPEAVVQDVEAEDEETETEVADETAGTAAEETEEDDEPAAVSEEDIATASDVVASGTCGNDLTWVLDGDYALTISGTGTMPSWSADYYVPWYSYRASILSVTIEDGATSIGTYAFDSCTSLTSVIIPDSVTDIGDYAFCGCTNLTSATIGNDVISIGENAFSGTSLTSVTIPDSVTSIGAHAFSVCTSLTSTTIPDSVTRIENYAFYGCTSLTDVYYAGSEDDWAAISIGISNSCLTSATIHYNSTGPEENPDDNKALAVSEISVTKYDEDEGDFTSYVRLKVGDTVRFSVEVTAEEGSSLSFDTSDWSLSQEGAATFSDLSVLGPTTDENDSTKQIYTVSITATLEKSCMCTVVFEYSSEISTSKSLTIFNEDGTFGDPDSEEEPDIDESEFINDYFYFCNSDGEPETGRYWNASSTVWCDGAYTQKEFYAKVMITYNPTGETDETATINKLSFSVDNLNMFKIEGDDEIEPNITLSPGETYEYMIHIVKRGILWKKPTSSEEEIGTITVTVDGDFPGMEMETSESITISYWNEDLDADKQQTLEESQEAEELTAEAAENSLSAYDEISSQIALNAQLDTYFSSEQIDGIKLIILTAITNTNMPEESWSAAKISNSVATQALNKYLGVSSFSVGMSVTEIPLEVYVKTDAYGTILLNLAINLSSFTISNKEFAILGKIDINMTFMESANKKSMGK